MSSSSSLSSSIRIFVAEEMPFEGELLDGIPEFDKQSRKKSRRQQKVTIKSKIFHKLLRKNLLMPRSLILKHKSITTIKLISTSAIIKSGLFSTLKPLIRVTMTRVKHKTMRNK